MEIQFQSTGNTSGFATWLKGFKEMSNTLLIEIDTTGKQFVSKTFTQDKTVVKFGRASFDEAGLEVVFLKGKDQKKMTAEEWEQSGEQRRILFGIYDSLDRFIKVVDLFSGSENFKFTLKFSDVDGKFITSKAEFKSLTLNMKVDGSDISNSEFKEISDEQFMNGIAAMENPMKFNVNIDVIKMLLNVSNIYSTDAKKDVIMFSSKKDGDAWTLHAIDHNSGSFDYIVAYLSADAQNPVETLLPVIRNNFILATKSDIDNATITLSGLDGQTGLKLRIDSGDNFSTVIASVNVDEN